MELFTKESVLGVRQVLLDWAASFHARVDPTARDWSCEIEQYLICMSELFHRMEST